jgi:hypothetical protein
MPKEYTLTPKLTPKFKLIVDHLNAVRTLNEYVNGVGLGEDMQALTDYLEHDLSRLILRPQGWEDLYLWEGDLYSSPLGGNPLLPKWRVVEDDEDEIIALEISPAWPVGDDNEPNVNLYVPPNWGKRQQFIDKLKPPPEFEHVNRYYDELAETNSIFKYVRYEEYMGPDGFDASGFIEAFRKATKALVALEKDIDQILESLT